MRLSNIALYDKSTIDFYNQGLGILSDAISSESTEAVQDNGNITYEMTLKYPINGVLADKLKLPNLIRAQESEDPNDFMIFEIYDYDEDDDGEMTVYAQALPYRVLRLPFNDDAKFATKYNDIQELFDDAIKRVTGFPTWFKINSDVKLASNLNFKDNQFENLGKLLEATMSLIDATVEYQWNQINILQSRGRDLTNIVLRDDKNTNGVKITGSYEKIINKVVPIIRNRDDKTGEFVEGSHMGEVVTSKDPFKWIPYYAGVTANFDSQEEANNYISSNKLDNPAITATVTPLMVDEDLTQVHAFDKITAYSTKLKYQDTLQVTTRVFDQLNAEVVSFTMGAIKKDVNGTTTYSLSSLASEIAAAMHVANGALKSANGKNTNNYQEETPENPIEGDLWFHKVDGKDVMQQFINGEWVTIGKDGMGEEIQAYVDQKMLENDGVMDKLHTDLESNAQIIKDNKQAVDDAMIKLNEDLTQAKSDLDQKMLENDGVMDKLHTDLQSNAQIIKDNKQAVDDAMDKLNEDLTQAKSDLNQKMLENNDAMDKLHTDLESNSQTIKDNKQAVDDAMIKVNEDLTQAKSAAESAFQKSDDAVGKAQSAVKASGLATTTANAANEAATAAKDLANSTANSFDKVKAQANTAANDASTALDQAKSAIGNSNTAISNAKDALNKVNGISVGGTNLLSNSRGKFQPHRSVMDNWAIYENSTVYMVKGQQYTVHADASSGLVWSGTHDSTVSNNVLLWLVNSTTYGTVNAIVSDANTGTGTTFTWNYPSGTYYLRVNTYTTDNSGYVENVKIEKGNLATDWSPSPEDAQVQISNINGELLQKVSQTDYDTLTNKVTKNTSQLKLTATSAALETQSQRVDTISGQVDTNTAGITAANGAIELKANNSRVDTLSNTVKQQGIDLKAAQGELNLKLTQSDLTKGLDGYATQTWAKNQIKINADGLEASLSKVSGDLANLQNLFPDPDITKQIKPTIEGDGMEFEYQGSGIAIRNHGTIQGRVYWVIPAVKRNSTYMIDVTTFGGTDSTSKIGFTSGDKGTLINPNDGDPTSSSYAQSYIVNTKQYTALSVWVQPGSSIGIQHLGLFWSTSGLTTAQFSDLKYTVDGFSTTFAKKTDLEDAKSNFKVTADGLNLITNVTGKNGEKVTQVIADVKKIQTTMTGDNGYTTRLQTLEGFQDTAKDDIKGLQSQQTKLAGQYTSVIGDLAVFQNLFAEEALNGSPAGTADRATVTYGGGLLLVNDANDIGRVYWTGVGVPSKTYSFRMAYNTNGASGIKISFYGPTAGSESEFNLSQPDGNVHIVEFTLKCPEDGSGSLNIWVPKGAHIRVTMLKMYNATGSVASSQITQLKDQIDLRTTVSGKVTAALNLSNDGGGTVTIRGASLYVTADSHFDNASIQSAAIASLDAKKITSGSISSDRLATTKLNADNITSGSISADRLATTKLNADNITSGSISADRIASTEINADNIKSGSINANLITTGYIATERLATTKLNADNITSGSIAAERLATTKLNADNITSGSIAAERIASTEINADNIKSGSINANLITTGSIRSERLATTKLNANNITSGSIAAERLATTKLNASNITTGSMNASLITAGSLNASRISGGTFNGDNMNIININGHSITAGTITADKLAANAILVGINNGLRRLRIDPHGLYLHGNSSDIGYISSSNPAIDTSLNGLAFNLSSTADYMSWAAQNRGDANGKYQGKLTWLRKDASDKLNLPSGFTFDDDALFMGGVTVVGRGVFASSTQFASPVMFASYIADAEGVDGRFGHVTVGGTKCFGLFDSTGKSGIAMSSSNLYFVRGGKAYSLANLHDLA